MFQRRAQNVDIELAEPSSSPRQLEGYPTFAEFIARDRDAAIYRRFERLSARNLLYQQSELHELERQLQELDHEDAKDINNQAARKAAVYWERFINDTSEEGEARRSLQAKIKAKLKEYHKALMLESQVLSLNAPGSKTLAAFRRWFRSMGTPVLWGHDERLFSDEHDLVALAPADTDRLNNLLKDHFGYFFKEKQAEIPLHSKGLYYFSETRIQRAGLVISTLLSAVLLVGAIVALLEVRDRSIALRVGAVVIFTCCFASVVGLLTNARRAEIFASTAAYAAVLVVFISNVNGS